MNEYGILEQLYIKKVVAWDFIRELLFELFVFPLSPIAVAEPRSRSQERSLSSSRRPPSASTFYRARSNLSRFFEFFYFLFGPKNIVLIFTSSQRSKTI